MLIARIISEQSFYNATGGLMHDSILSLRNHIHLICQQNKLNGKETPKGSLLKYTGHQYLKNKERKKSRIHMKSMQQIKNMRYGKGIRWV